jgi:hypothetical protein
MVAEQQAAALRRYERDGYAVFRSVLDAELVGEASDHVAWLLDRHPDVPAEQLGHTFMPDDPFWFRLVSDERLVDLAAVFVGPNVALYASHYISKPPFSGQPVLWHQDGAYWPLDPIRVVTLWLAVDESTPENGCLRVIPGSHRQDLAALRANTEVDNVLGSESDVEVDESQAVDLTMSPGDVEVHHPNILHGSAANASPHRRCGLTIRYIPTSTRILSAEQPFPSAFHLRGDPGVNRYQPRPRYVAGQHFSFAGAEAFA